MTDKPYTVASLAALWGVSDTFVYDEIKRGNLGHMRLGGKLIRIPVADVEAYEARATVAASDETAAPARPVERTDPATIGRLLRGR